MPRMNPLFVAIAIAVTSPAALSQSMHDSMKKDSMMQDTKMDDSKHMMDKMVAPSPVRAVDHHDLNKKKGNLAIKGYDPVAYFGEGGGKATKGKKSISTKYKNITYYFSSEANKKLFLADPAKYEPAFGGWCAWAMSTGEKTSVNPKTFIVKNNRLYLFYNGVFGNTKKEWSKGNHTELSATADTEWKTISGESPRIAMADTMAP